MADKPDQATAVAIEAINSGHIVPPTGGTSEVLVGVERSGIREARDLRDMYEAYRPRPDA